MDKELRAAKTAKICVKCARDKNGTFTTTSAARVGILRGGMGSFLRGPSYVFPF